MRGLFDIPKRCIGMNGETVHAAIKHPSRNIRPLHTLEGSRTSWPRRGEALAARKRILARWHVPDGRFSKNRSVTPGNRRRLR